MEINKQEIITLIKQNMKEKHRHAVTEKIYDSVFETVAERYIRESAEIFSANSVDPDCLLLVQEMRNPKDRSQFLVIFVMNGQFICCQHDRDYGFHSKNLIIRCENGEKPYSDGVLERFISGSHAHEWLVNRRTVPLNDLPMKAFDRNGISMIRFAWYEFYSREDCDILNAARHCDGILKKAVLQTERIFDAHRYLKNSVITEAGLLIDEIVKKDCINHFNNSNPESRWGDW